MILIYIHITSHPRNTFYAILLHHMNDFPGVIAAETTVVKEVAATDDHSDDEAEKPTLKVAAPVKTRKVSTAVYKGADNLPLESKTLANIEMFKDGKYQNFWSLKGPIVLATGQGILADFWVPHEIESCNFHNLLVFKIPEISQNLILFSQLLFSLFQMGDPLKKSKKHRNLPNYPALRPR